MAEISKSINVELNLTLDTILGSEVSYDNDGEASYNGGVSIGAIVADRIADRLIGEAKTAVDYSEIQPRVNAAIDEAVAGKLAGFLDREIMPTDPWGNPRGEPRTLTQEIVDHAQKWFTQEVGDYNKRQTRASKVISEAVDRALTKELKTAIDAAKAEITAKVQAHAAKVLAETITSAVKL